MGRVGSLSSNIPAEKYKGTILAGLTFGMWADHTSKTDVWMSWIPVESFSYWPWTGPLLGLRVLLILLLVVLLVWTAPSNTLRLPDRLHFSALKHSSWKKGNSQLLNCSLKWWPLSQRCRWDAIGGREPSSDWEGQGRLLGREIRASLLGRKPWGGHSGHREKDKQRHGSNS